jgi:hypothetical protein
MAGRPAVSMVGFKTAWLEVIEAAGSRDGSALWRCRCHGCGRDDHVATGTALRSGDRKSCGCMRWSRDDPPFPVARPARRPAGTTLSGRERDKRAEAAAGATAVTLEPPGPDDVCQYRQLSDGETSRRPPVCGRPTVAQGHEYCSTHAGVARDGGSGSYVLHTAEAVAATLAEGIVGGCADCGARWATTARKASARFRKHRETCGGGVSPGRS